MSFFAKNDMVNVDILGMASIEQIRHSLSHLLAAAIIERYPGTKLGIGPTIENGFYYDFLLPSPIALQDLPVLENKIKSLIKKNFTFEKEEVSANQAKEIFNDQPFNKHREYLAKVSVPVAKFPETSKIKEIIAGGLVLESKKSRQKTMTQCSL